MDTNMRMTSNAEARSRNSSDPGGVASFRSNAVEDENFPSENTPSIWSWAPKSRTSVAFILASLTDTILLLAAIAFLVLDFAAITRKNEPIDSTFGRYIEEIEKWSATIYPMVFGALMSRSLKTIGRYFAERGIRLSNLCLMMNSSLMYDPMVNFIYAPISIFTVALFLIWACSPVGGQASLRLVHRQNITSTAQREIRYQDTGPEGQRILTDQDAMIAINTYMGSFTQTESAILGPVDNWGNIKIPRIDAFKENSIEPDNGWYDAEKLPKGLEIWSGLFGLPVLGLSQFTNQKVEFTTKSVYIQPSCYNAVDNGKVGPFLGLNVSLVPLVTDGQLARYRRELEDFPSYPAQIVAVNTRDYNGIHTFQCKLEQRVVEAQIRCDYGACAAVKVRHFEDKPFGGVNFTQIYYRGEPYLGFFYQTCHSEVEDGTPVPLICPAQVILNGTTKFSFHRMGDDYTTYSQNVSTIPTSKLSARFGMLLNTIVASAKTGFALFGGLPYSNLTFYGSSRPPESWEYGVDYVPHFDAPFTGAAANATVVTDHEVFNPTYAWCILSIVSSCVLITLGVGNALCNFRTLTPNMFDPVMGWTYMNPYMPLPPSSPDESEYPLAVEARLGALGKMTVRLGRPYDQTWATAQEKDDRFEALREVVPFEHNDPDQTDVEVEEPHHRESIYAPIVLGFKDKVRRLGRKDIYQSSSRSQISIKEQPNETGSSEV